jgi:hypothetical protein
MNFDDEWIKKFDNSKIRPRSLKVVFFYIDKENMIQQINQDVIDVSNNILSKNELVKLIIKNRKKHELFSIVSYIVGDVNNSTDYSSFFREIKIENLSFENSHRIFESTNTLYFIFKELDKKLKHNTTKKIKINSTGNTRRKRT